MMQRIRRALESISTKARSIADRRRADRAATSDRSRRDDDVMPVNPMTVYPTAGSSGPAY